MQTKTIAIAGAASRFLSLKANFKQIKKWLLPAAFFLAFAFFAAPASAQVNITAQVPTNPFSNYQVFFNVTFTTTQTGLSASNFTLTGTVTGASIQGVAGSGTSWGVTVEISNSYQSSGTLILNMVNNTGVSPGVSGLPVASPSVTDVLYPLTGSATLTSFNANPGYAKTGDIIDIDVISDHYFINQVSGSVGNGNDFATGPANGSQGGVPVTLGSGIPQGPLAYTWGFYTIYETLGGGSGTSGIIFDSIDPTVSISAPSATTVTGNGTSSVSYAVTYADANFGNSNLTASGITLNSTGSTTGTVSVSGSGTSYTVTIANIIGAGTLGISVGAGYAADLAGNTDAGAGPSSTVTVQMAQPSISYTGPNLYPINTAITPLSPAETISTSVFAGTVAGTGLALDYNSNAYIISSSSEIFQYQPGNGSVPLPNNSSANIAIAPISGSTSTLLSAFGGAFRAMDINNGTFNPPVAVCSTSGTGNLVAATHPASGPEIAMINKGYDASGQIAFLTRTGGTWSSPAIITNAFPGPAMAINNYQGGLKLAYIGTDNNLYYATYSGGAWSAVAPWATPNISLNGVTAFTLDAQGNVWYANGSSLNELIPGSTSPLTVATLSSAPNAIAFDIAGNLYVNLGTTIEKLAVINNFQVSPGLPAGLTINNATGVISGTPTAISPATQYTVTAVAGGSNLSATINIQTITTPTLSYGSALNATIGTSITSISPTSTSILPQKYNSTPTIFASVSAPTGLAIDASGNVYVNQSAGTTGISSFPAAGGSPTALNVGFPGSIFIDAAANLYAPNSLPAAEFTFTMYPGGVTTTSFTFSGGAPYGNTLTNVQGLVVDQAGNVYAGGASTDGVTSTNKVYEYPNRLFQNGNFGALAIGSGFTSISGVAADAAGNIYVSDAGAGAIDIIPATRGQWTTLVSGLGAPANICIDGAGNLYFSDNIANTISEIPAGSTTPVLIASGLGSITALAIDGQGNLFAADNTNSVIDKFVPTGGYYISPVLPSGLGFNGATGVVSGTPVVASAATNYAITAYNTLGSASATQSISVTAALPALSYSSGLSFTIGETVVPVTPTSTGVATQGYSTIPSFIDHQFGAPYAVAVDTSLNVFVADPYNYNTKSVAYSPTGNYAQLAFAKGGGAPIFFTPTTYQLTGLATDSTGHVFVAKSNSPASMFTPYPSSTETSLATVAPVNNVATDAYGNFFATQGTSLIEIPLHTGPATTITSGFNTSVGIAVDGPGNIFVSDRGTNTLYKIPAGSNTPTAAATGFNMAWQLAADGIGNVFIADGGNGAVKELPAGGGAVTTVISNLKTPNGVAVDISGALYVADAGFAQVRKYTPSGGYYISPALPTGLSFNNSTGVISGTPTAVTPVKDYKITAYNLSGSTQTTVRFGVTPPSSNLAGLAVSAGTLSPGFASAITAYSVSVPYNTPQITVTPTTLDGGATMTVNGTAVSSGSPSGAIALSVGANTITIVVTASDHSSTQTYTVTVNRSGPSNNALLSNVGIGYVISGSTVEAVVTPATSDPNATVTVNGVTVASGAASNPIPLSPGANSITIQVTAQDGLTKITYKITVDGPLGSTSTLSSLTISAGTLSPAFSPGTTSYTDAVNNSVASVTVTPTTTDPNATVTVNAATVASGTPSNAIGLNVGNNTISTLVTAQDGVTTTTYTITVTRAAYPAALTALAVSTGTYSPAFAQATLNYTETIPYTTAQIAITPTTAYPTATVTVNGTAVASGTASGLITLPVGANTINVVVTASDGVTKQTYTLVVTRLPSINATLSAITLNHGTLSPTFAAATFSYTATVPYATTSVTLKPVAGNGSATIKVNGAAVTSNTASGAIALNVGSNLITTIVTAQDGVTMDTYTVTITRLPVSTNATLAGIVPNKGSLSPTFASATTSYTVMETNGTASVGITPTAADPTATITVNGTAVASGVSSAAIALSVGTNTITILVTAQDGVTKDTYTLNVIRPSTNAKLSNLVISSGTLSPVFAGATTAYTASVANSVMSITLTPMVAAAGATVLINGTAVASGTPSAAVALGVGGNTITTVVTAQDGVTTFTYTVTVTRAKSSNANLANITLNKGTLSPAFASTTTSYTDMVTNGITAVTLTPTVQDNTATLTVNGTVVTSGSASGSLALVVGSNIETVVVTAQDGVTIQTYTVNVIRPSTNAKLSILKLSSGTLTPAFNTNTVSYTASVPYTTSTIMITPTVAVTGATVKVNGTTVTSGTPSAAVALSVGGNTITTVVTAQDGTTTDTYTVVVTRANPSINNNLSNLTISKGTLSPAFSATTTAYTDMVTNGTTSLTVTPSLADATASVTVNGTTVASGSPSGAIALNVGSNTINIVVTAQSGATQTYAVTVIRPSTNAKLANLTTNAGAITPVFNPAATSYTLSVTNATTSLTITPTVAVAGATVKVNSTTVTSGTPSAAIALSVGSNPITTIVTAQDGVTTATYTINVTRAAPGANIPDETVSVDKPIETLDLANDGINVHQGLSPNGDGINDFLQIDHIASYPDNNLKIMNRNGQLVYEAKGYDNATKAFDGHSNKNGQMQLPGTYFYALDYTVNGIIKHKTGFLVLKY